MLGKPRRTASAHLRTFAQTKHISKVPASTFVCHNSARAENCKTYTFHDHEHKFKRAEKSVLLKIQVYLYMHTYHDSYFGRTLFTSLLFARRRCHKLCTPRFFATENRPHQITAHGSGSGGKWTVQKTASSNLVKCWIRNWKMVGSRESGQASFSPFCRKMERFLL